MSGPKVVRIVTREEIVAICRGQLAQLGSFIEEWERVGKRNGTVADADVEAVLRRRDEIRRLLEHDRFVDLQKAVPAEIEFLRADQQARLARAVAEAAAERSARVRTAAVAAAVVNRLQSTGTAIPDDLRRELEAVAAGRSEAPGAVSRALSLLAPAPAGGVTERQRELAAALRGDDEREGIQQWIAAQVPEADPGVTRLEARISELSVLRGGASVSPFEGRLRSAIDAPAARRGLLMDSLEADLASELRAARSRAVLQAELRALAAELLDSGHAELARMAEMIVRRVDADDDELRQLAASARSAREAFHAGVAARARRQAILSGLAGLGYQVSEGMETAWVQDGRVVVKNASRPGYGVEIAGGADAARLQVRTVAFRSPGAAADPARDTDAETLWCGDLHALEARLAAEGGALHIDIAKPAGAVPLKVVAEDGVTHSVTDQILPGLRTRTAG